MNSHVWVRITILPINVELITVRGGDEVFHYTYATAEKLIAEEESAFGCYLCDLPMTAESFHLSCTGVPDDIAEALLNPATDPTTHDADGYADSPD